MRKTRRVQARVLVGRCLPYGEGITYWPLQELASQVGDVRAALQGASDAELAAVRIGAALGATDTPVSPEEISWGVRRLLEAMATTGPLVVVFDDIHWAETEARASRSGSPPGAVRGSPRQATR